MKRIITIIIILLPLLSGAQIVVHLTILPPYSTKLSDYFSRPQQVLLMVQNTSATLQNVQLRGEFTGDNGVSIRADQNYKSSSPIRLGPNETRTLGINDIAALFNINEVTFTGITKEQFIRQNGVPDGNYQICVQAFDYYTNKSLSGAAPAGCSNIFPVSSVEDPTVIAPYDGQTVSALAGQNFVISWSTPAGAPPSTQYTVKIVQIFDGKSPADAFNTAGIPIFFQQTVTGSNSLVYGPAMPALTLGRHYAMAVTASDPMNSVTFKNHGQSVISTFIYGDTASRTGTTTPAKAPVKNTTTATAIPVSTLSATVNWFYLQSEEHAPAGRVAPSDNYPLPQLPGSLAHKVPGAHVYVNIQPLYKNTGKASAAPVKTVPIRTLPGHGNAMAVHLTAADTVYQGSSFTATTDADGNFQLPIAGVSEGISQNTAAAYQALGMSAPDSVVVFVEVQRTWGTGTQDFGPYDYPVSALANGGALNLGLLKAKAYTFRFLPTVKDQNGNELTDALVNVYRRSDFYTANPGLTDEGNFESNQANREQDQIDGVMYTKVATLSSGNAATRLFFNALTDSYKVQITEGNHIPFNTTLNLTGPNAYITGMSIPQTYVMQNGRTTFAGTVTRSVNGIQSPAAGAVVSFINNFHQFAGATDSLGHFSIVTGYTMDFQVTHDMVAGIMPSPDPMAFTVSYNGQIIADQVTIDKPNQTYTRNETFKTDAIPVSGTIVDDNHLPISNPVIRWKSGLANVTTDAQGNFSTYGVEGTDSLIISKLGYADKHVAIVITQGLVFLKQGTQQTPVAGRRFITTTNFNPISSPLQNALNGNVGNVTMDRLTGIADIYVTDQRNAPVANATLTIEGYPDEQALMTDDKGYLHIIGPAGEVMFDVQGPAGTNYVPAQFGYTIYANNTAQRLNMQLQDGVKVSGTVRANGTPVAGATVGMQFQDFGTVTTSADGSYSIIIPKGFSTLKGSKQGFLADIKPGTYTAASTVNFNLTTSSLKLDKLLGFSVQVDEIKDKGNTKLITGEFINLPSNQVFTVQQGTKLRFADVPVTVQPDQSIIPVDDKIYTLESAIKLKAFNFLPLNVSNDGLDEYNDVIWVARRTGNHGQVMGQLLVDFTNFTPMGIPAYYNDQLPLTNNAQHDLECAVITDDGSVSGNTVLNFPNQANTTINFDVYGFDVNVNAASTYVRQDGMHVAGSVDVKNVPALSGTNLFVKDFWVGTDGRIKSVSAQPDLQINIAGWTGQIQSLGFNDNGFTLAGNLQVQLPNTQGTSNVGFTGLQLSKNSLYGGSFTLPQAGINVFGIANITGNQLTFGQAGNSNAYYISGTGSIKFTGAGASYIDPISLSQFQLQTNGQFAVTAQTGLTNHFFGGVADYNVSQLSISNTNNQPKIDLQGNFGLNIPDLASLNAGGIHFGSGGSVSVDNIGLSVNIAGIANANVNLGFQNNSQGKGFSGTGTFDVAHFANINCNFHYFKVNGGTDIATTFSTSTFIPLGASGFSITNLGGGFSANTAKKSWGVDINGTVAVGESCFASADVDFSIKDGPLIKGSAMLNIGELKDIGHGQLTIDVPNQIFTVSYIDSISMAGLSENAGGQVILSLNPSDKYFLLGTTAKYDAFGIIKFNGAACLAYNLNIPRHSRDLAGYIAAIPAAIRSNSQLFSGASALANFNYSLDDILPNFDVDLGIIDFGLHSHFDMSANGYVLAGLVNNVSPTFSTGFAVNWACGGSAYFGFLGDNINVGMDVGFNAGFNGTAQFNPYHLSMQATAGAYFHAFWGDISPGYCISGTNIPWYRPDHWWISLCANPQLTIGYDNHSGFSWHF